MVHPRSMVRPTRRSRRRALRRRALLLALLLPGLLLLLGTVVGVQTAWVHSHGEEAGHVHLLAEHADSGEAIGLESWHEHQHDGEEPHDEHEPTPPGLLIDLPPLVAGHQQTANPADIIASSCVRASLAWVPGGALGRIRHRPEVLRSGWPPQENRRSGIAALLGSSHAILI